MTRQHISLWTIIVLGTLTAITPLSTDMYLPSLPSMTHELQTNASMVQLTLGIMTLGIGIGQLIAGPLGDRYGRRTPTLIGSLLCTLATWLCATAPTVEILLVGRFLQGLTGSIGVVLSKAMARDLVSGPALTQLFSSLMMVNGLAPVVAPLIGGYIVLYGTWRIVFYVLTIITFAMLCMTWTLEETLPPSQRQPSIVASLRSYGTIASDKLFLGQIGIQFFSFAAFFAYISGSSFVFQNIYHLSPQWFSYLFGINSCGIILASYVSTKISNYVSSYKILMFSLWQLTIGSTVFLASMIGNTPVWVPALILFLTVCTVAPIGAASFSIAMERYGNMAGSASALLGSVSMLAAAIVSPLVGIGGTHTGVPMGIIMVICSLSSIACLRMSKNST